MTDFYARKPGTWTWEVESTLLFMMTSFLKSRTEAGLPSNAEYYDEDVNVYLAGLLTSYVDPQFMDVAGRYISPFDIDVAGMAQASDYRQRYTIYKVNADHLLVSAGIFDPDDHAATTGVDDDASPLRRTAISRGPTYYRLAASFGRMLARRDTAAIDVLAKLSRGFPQYITILNHLRTEYFNLIERLSSREVAEIHTGIDAEARKAELTERTNRLLDLYSEWLRRRDPALIDRMRALAGEIRDLDPDFRFDIPDA